jgi:hypothetical protein
LIDWCRDQEGLGWEKLDTKAKQVLEQMLATRSTKPQSREECRHCVYMRRVVGSRPIGPLAKPKPPAMAKEPDAVDGQELLAKASNDAF